MDQILSVLVIVIVNFFVDKLGEIIGNRGKFKAVRENVSAKFLYLLDIILF